LPDADSKEFLRRVVEMSTPPLTELTPRGAREVNRRLEKTFVWDAGVEVGARDATIPGPGPRIPVRIFTPERGEKSNLPVLVYFHGGGWVVGGQSDLDVESTCKFLVDGAGCVVVSVGYRLAPESKFPAAVEDAYATLLWVAANAGELNGDAKRIAVGGDSAGGNIAAAVCLMARDRDGPDIVFQLLVYPVTDHSFETESYRTCGEGYGLATEEMKWFWNHYLRTPADGENGYASPLRARDLRGLPPALVLTAECDPLRDEGEAYGHRLEEAGVPAKIVRYEGAIHGFFTLPFGGKGRAEAAKELRRAFTQKAE
jgi:acetyl esterase